MSNWSHFYTGKGDMVGMKGSPTVWPDASRAHFDVPMRTGANYVHLRCSQDALSIIMQVTRRRWPKIWKRSTKMETVASVPYRIKKDDMVTLASVSTERSQEFIAKVNDEVVLRYPNER